MFVDPIRFQRTPDTKDVTHHDDSVRSRLITFLLKGLNADPLSRSRIVLSSCANAVEALERRQLLTSATFGWDFAKPASHPSAWMNNTGTTIQPSSFNAENLSDPTGSFAAALGTDSLGRYRYGPVAGATPANGNYEFTAPLGDVHFIGETDGFATDFFVNADFNHSRSVDFGDLLVQSQNYNETATTKTFAQGDMDGDGDIDQADVQALSDRFNTRLAASPSYAGEVTVSSMALQPDGSTPLVVNWAPVSDATLQASDPANADKTISGYTVYRSTDGNNFISLADVARTVTGQAGVYAFTDSTPVDGVKYYYRIRPFYGTTAADGSAAHEHLATTNKSWRVSALKAPSAIDATLADDTMFVSWKDNSSSETGYEIEQQSNDGTWVVVGTAGANETTFAFDSDAIESESSMTNNVRVRAVSEDAGIETAPAEATPSELTGVTNFRVELARRVSLSSADVSYTFDAGSSHAGQTFEVQDLGAVSALQPGAHQLDANGRATIMILNRNRITTSHQTVVFQDGDTTVFIEPTQKECPINQLPDSISIPHDDDNLPKDTSGVTQYPTLSPDDAIFVGGFGPPPNNSKKFLVTAAIIVTAGAPPFDQQVTIAAGSQIEVIADPNNPGGVTIIAIKNPPPPPPPPPTA